MYAATMPPSAAIVEESAATPTDIDSSGNESRPSTFVTSSTSPSLVSWAHGILPTGDNVTTDDDKHVKDTHGQVVNKENNTTTGDDTAPETPRRRSTTTNVGVSGDDGASTTTRHRRGSMSTGNVRIVHAHRHIHRHDHMQHAVRHPPYIHSCVTQIDGLDEMVAALEDIAPSSLPGHSVSPSPVVIAALPASSAHDDSFVDEF